MDFRKIDSESIKKLLVKKRITIGIILSIVLLIVSKPNIISILSGIPFIISGEGLRVWASGYIVKGINLTCDGPYAHVRNPLYFGSFLIGLGFCIAARNTITLLIFIPLFFAVYGMAIMREENELLNKFGEKFIYYKCDVPRFIPKIKGSHGYGADYQWERFRSNKEYRAIIGIMIFTIFLILKTG